eukprot:GHUV01017051.1.p2 GENE.GHUV01017051.1~~GHUV01017051.1.p2  ORF type:complete len:117 (-),score=16.79 GHUV01017051.1:1655-2005(-)
MCVMCRYVCIPLYLLRLLSQSMVLQQKLCMSGQLHWTEVEHHVQNFFVFYCLNAATALALLTTHTLRNSDAPNDTPQLYADITPTVLVLVLCCAVLLHISVSQKVCLLHKEAVMPS